MRILVTGNMGYVGSVLVNHLRRVLPNAVLIGFDAGFFSTCLTERNLCPEVVLNQQHFGDTRQSDPQLLVGVDAIVHLAAISNDPMGDAFEAVTMQINHAASVTLAQKAKAAGVKSFIFASSCSVYGSADDSARTEKSALNPLTAYARSKIATERDLEPLADDRFQITCLRFATACGWSARLRLDLVLNDFVASALANRQIEILSDGTPLRPLIDVKDMARAIEWAIARPHSSGGRYLTVNVGSNDGNYQVKDLAHAVNTIIPEVEVKINKNAQPDKRSYRVDFSLFKKLAPLHQPDQDLARTIRELKTGLESFGFADRDFRNSRLVRLKALYSLRSSGYLDDALHWKLLSGNDAA
jgi:nucleoside-diphosphate-sugar epimerase